MADANNYPVWPGWETVRLIGRGSFGAVYEIQREIFGDTEKAALKVISIPQNPGDVEEMISDGYDSESITDTFNGQLRSIVAEYSMMRKMNGSANVVNCDDVRYIQHENGLGWDIVIKMELLTPLVKALPETTDDGLAQCIAVDICRALVLCKKYDIVHRDIKPQNIFLSDNGDFKLGDFGIAKTVEKTTGGTKIGTYKYMAPEVYNNQPYGSGADIYSLGLVLYWLLNNRRMPFMPLPPQKIKAGDEENARLRRFAGEPIPAPKNGSEELKRIVLKACAYDVNDRYHSADEMLADLEALGGTKSFSVAASAPAQTSAQTSVPGEDDADKTVGVWSTSEKAVPGQEDADKTVGVWGTCPKTEAAAEDSDKTLGVWDTSEKSSTASKDEDETIGAWKAPEKTASDSEEEDKTVGVWNKPESAAVENAPAAPAPKKKKKGLLIGLIAAVLAVVAMVYSSYANSETDQWVKKVRTELQDGSYIIDKINLRGIIINHAVYNADNSIFSITEYDSNGNKTRTTCYNTNGSIYSVTEYDKKGKKISGSVSRNDNDTLVGVAMPTKDLRRWDQDGDNIKKELEAAGYHVDLQYAANDVPTQIQQIENMIANGCKVLVIAPVDGFALDSVLAQAKEKDIKVISYDRLIMNSDAVSYYATFDNWLVGVKQGEFIEEKLGLKEGAKGHFTIEFITGDPGDNNINFFFDGAMSILQPYLDSGVLLCISGQTEKAVVATDNWSTDHAKERFVNIITNYYEGFRNLDAVLASNDSIALGVENALAESYHGNVYPIITGQDCDIAIMKNLIEGKQSMSVFKDTRVLVSQVAEMVEMISKGEEPPINDVKTYDNGTGIIPSILCEPVICTANNYREILVDSGYYTEDQLT